MRMTSGLGLSRVLGVIFLLLCSCHQALGFLHKATIRQAGSRANYDASAALVGRRASPAQRAAGRLTMQQTDEEIRKTKLRLRYDVVFPVHPPAYKTRTRSQPNMWVTPVSAFMVKHDVFDSQQPLLD